PVNRLINGILMGEFRFDLGFAQASRADFVDTKQRIFEGDSTDPRFIYMHSGLPGHSQFSGACRADETEQYAERLELANNEMREDIQRITEHDPAGIIIVAGDHGPYLTKNFFITDGE